MKKKKTIVVAHPDDEILWFSSFLREADQVVVCFCNSEKAPELTKARQQLIRRHPLQKIIWLELDQSDTFGGADWNNPQRTEYGIRITDKRISDEKYRRNFRLLHENLASLLTGTSTVFTHNPWGEYGSEDHIQVHTVVKSLSRKLGFDLWFSNYVSEKTLPLLLKIVPRVDNDYILKATDEEFAGSCKKLYEECGCWTWYDEWQWLPQEAFLKETKQPVDQENAPHFPLNMMYTNTLFQDQIPLSTRIKNKLLLWRQPPEQISGQPRI